MRKFTKGKGKPTIGIIGRLHGNEPLGEQAIELLLKKNIDAKVMYIIANEEAGAKNVRFIESDLNRSFPGKTDGSHEERLAARILEELKHCEFVIDIHSTIAQTEPFIILTKDTQMHLKLANSMPLTKMVFIRGTLAKGNALIDHVRCGISIEFQKNTTPDSVAELAEQCIHSLKSDLTKFDRKEVFEVYDILLPKKGLRLTNFTETTINGETFVPILFGEAEYKKIACLKARRLQKKD